MKDKTLIACAFGLLLLGAFVWSGARASATPGARAADPTPADGRTVLRMDLMVTSDAPDAASTVTQVSCQVVDAWSNKSLYAGPGQWIVQLNVAGDQPDDYGVLDPRFADVEANADQPAQEVFLPSTEWLLDVPLYDDATDLHVQEVDIYDQSGQVVFAESVGSDGSCEPASLPNARGAGPTA